MGNRSSSTLPPQLVEEMEEMTSFSYSEITDLYRQFRHDCPDLKMTVDQFKILYRQTFPNGNPDSFAEHVFQTFDVEKRGYIDFRQFLTTLSSQLKGNFQEKLEWLFNLYDNDKDNTITKWDLLTMITAVHNLRVGALPSEDQISPQELVDHILKQADRNQDGMITREDFISTAMTSNTLAAILQGTMKAADDPYTKRKERRGSIGLPLHHRHHLEADEGSAGGERRGSKNTIPAAAASNTLQVPGNQPSNARRPSLTPDMLDFNNMQKH